MLRKLSSLFLLLVFLSSTQAVQAGVMTRMVEVEKEPVDTCCPALEECKREKAQLQSQNSDLKNRISKLMGELTTVRDENARLKARNSELTNKLAALRTSITKKTEVKEVIKKTAKPASPAKYAKKDNGYCLACRVGNVVSPVISTPIGAVMGTARGAVTKGASFANGASEAMGGSLPAKVVGNVGGGLLGLVVGGVTGVFKGIVNGIRYGFTRPFSPESFSTAGPFAEYDTFNYSDY